MTNEFLQDMWEGTSFSKTTPSILWLECNIFCLCSAPAYAPEIQKNMT